MTTNESIDFRFAIPLSNDNFAPLARTPWAGRQIAARLKRHILGPIQIDGRIGESWEISCDQEFPSRLRLNPKRTLTDLFREHVGEFTANPNRERRGHIGELLVKLLEADQPLSLQVHPKDSDPNLKSSECGKPESWYVIDAEPGAGIYLGFREPIANARLRQLILDGADLSHVLHFVPVRTGDYFEIEPGVPHAIGRGVLLLEPQRQLPEKSGKTFRLWDWNRRYNAHGVIDELHGKPRDLHLDAALELIDGEKQVGDAFVQSLRRHPQIKSTHSGSIVQQYPSNPYYQTTVIQASPQSVLTLRADGDSASIVNLAGRIELRPTAVAECIPVTLRAGESAILPRRCFPHAVTITATTHFAVIAPAGTTIAVS